MNDHVWPFHKPGTAALLHPASTVAMSPNAASQVANDGPLAEPRGLSAERNEADAALADSKSAVPSG